MAQCDIEYIKSKIATVPDFPKKVITRIPDYGLQRLLQELLILIMMSGDCIQRHVSYLQGSSCRGNAHWQHGA